MAVRSEVGIVCDSVRVTGPEAPVDVRVVTEVSVELLGGAEDEEGAFEEDGDEDEDEDAGEDEVEEGEELPVPAARPVMDASVGALDGVEPPMVA